jgi:hypothetical protein
MLRRGEDKLMTQLHRGVDESVHRRNRSSEAAYEDRHPERQERIATEQSRIWSCTPRHRYNSGVFPCLSPMSKPLEILYDPRGPR